MVKTDLASYLASILKMLKDAQRCSKKCFLTHNFWLDKVKDPSEYSVTIMGYFKFAQKPVEEEEETGLEFSSFVEHQRKMLQEQRQKEFQEYLKQVSACDKEIKPLLLSLFLTLCNGWFFRVLSTSVN